MGNIDASTPWYKQFWPWFLIAVPFATLIMGYVLFYLATHTEHSLVVDDYYKEGKAINMSIDRIEEAKRRNIQTSLTIDNGAIALQFDSGVPKDGTAMKLSFYHVTLKSRDVEVLLSRDAKGIYRAFTEADLSGKWLITLTPFDEAWKIQKNQTLPYSGPFALVP